jgi:O-antigen/teichoic acid export membrane protein
MNRDRYWNNVLAVLSGTTVAQIIPIAGALVIARQYPPSDFGIFSAWLGIVLFMAVVLTGRFETALAIVPDGEPRRLAVLSTIATAMISACISSIILFAVFRLISDITTKVPLIMVILVVPTGLLIASIQTWQSWASAEGTYDNLSYMRIVQAAATTVIQIAAGSISPSATSLAVGYTVGAVVGLAISAYLLPLGWFPKKKFKQTVANLWSQYRRFPLFSLPADSLNTAAAELPVILVASRFGTEIAGQLAMTMRILGAPIGLLGKSVLDVFKRHAAASYRERGECRSEYVLTLRTLAMISVGFCVVIASVSEAFFAFAFGEIWRNAGTIAVWLLPLFAFRFMASPLSYMVYIVGKQHVDLVWQVALLAMTMISLNMTQDAQAALQIYSAGYSFMYIIYIVMTYRFSLGNHR